MKVKKRLALFISAAMTFSMFTAYPAATAEASEFVNSTYFYGFDDSDSLPSEFTTLNTSVSSVANGIWTVTGSTVNPRIYLNQPIDTDGVSQLTVRMKTRLTGSSGDTAKMIVFFKDTDMDNDYKKDGVTCKVEKSNIPLATDGYVTYTLDLSSHQKYSSLDTITTIRIDIVDKLGSVDIDYIMLYKEDSNIKVWDFDSDTDLADWVPKSGMSNVASPSVSGGLYTQTAAGASTAPRLVYSPSEQIYTTDYDCIEVIMKHAYDANATAADKARLNMYLTGTNYSSGTPVDLDPRSARVQNTLSDSSGDNFYRYVFKFEKLQNNTAINDAKLTQIRIDPIRDAGTYYIDSIRLIPKNYADMADVGGHEEGSDEDHLNMGFVVETDDISEYKSLKVKINNGSKRLVGGYDLSDTFGSMSGPVKLGLQINDVPKDYENYITVQLSPDAVKSVNANETDLAN